MEPSMARAPYLPVLLFLSLGGAPPALGGMDSCYDQAGAPQYCLPGFENAAFLRQLLVTNTCGSPPEEYCLQTGSRGASTPCHRCDAGHPSLHHNASALTDLHSDEAPTWWQSQSMALGVQYPHSVNITLHLGKSHEITYVRLKFHTSRPESFAIYKRSRADGPWVPYQYYSATCQKTYGKPEGGYLRPGDDEAAAFCTAEFSDISPLSGGNVAFSTLEGRPGAYNFDRSPTLQEWVTSTDLRISLNRLNTFGDDIFKDKRVLQSYFYAISDFSVGGRCKCNGHASECVANARGQLTCNCQHNTTGVDCERCHPFYQDRPWARGTSETANECLACDCHGLSEECFFDPELYRSTGHGGHCQNCRAHTAGPHCEHCQENFFRDNSSGTCLPCQCSPAGSLNLQCDSTGTCDCKPSVTGRKCDHCSVGFHSFTEVGCRPCSCHPAGTVGECHPETGRCPCKSSVEGHLCDRCVPGTFNLQPQHPGGCSPCFCFGHSTVCTAGTGHGEYLIHSDFAHGEDSWRGEGAGGREIPIIWNRGEISGGLDGEGNQAQDIYFVAPEKFLGDQHLSYGQQVSVRLRARGGDDLLLPATLVLQGAGRTLSMVPSPSADCALCALEEKEVAFRLSEEENGEYITWPSFNFHRLLSNLTSLRIRASGAVSLRQVTLTSARPGLSSPAPWVEECMCPQGYIGQFCQSCAPGYTRVIPSGGPFASCVPCACNQHGSCDPDTGVCHCLHHTEGPSCEFCTDGFYGSPHQGGVDDCQPCPCPGGSSCAVMPTSGEVVCTNCPPGRIGRRCEVCDEGLYGDPLGRHGPVRPCDPCDCSGNVDPTAIGNCDSLSGNCLRCLHNTAGNRCERCHEGFYGDARAEDQGAKCAPCNCHQAGSAGYPQICDPITGQCVCLPHVIGQDCSQCRPGFYGMQPGIGCQSCNCHPVGSQSAQCHPITGQCVCHLGVEGVSCHRCHDGYFGFSSRGCRSCNCSPLGSITHQCHGNGTCACRRGFVGYKCDQCEQNFFYSPDAADCDQCPLCYTLLKEQANQLTRKLDEMEAWWLTQECVITGPSNGHHWAQQDSSRGDALPGSLMLQGARGVFMVYIQQLESSVSSAWKQLRNSSSTSCAGLQQQKSCALLSELDAVFASVQRETQLAAGTLRTMVFPHDLSGVPSEWTRVAVELRTLAQRHRDFAAEVTAAASQAILVSNTSYQLLHSALEEKLGDSEELEDRYQEIQGAQAELGSAMTKAMSEAKHTTILTRKVNVELAQNNSALSMPRITLLDQRATNLSTDLAEAEQELASWDQNLQEMALFQGEAQQQLEKARQFEQLPARARSALHLASVAVLDGEKAVNEAVAILGELEGTRQRLARQKNQGALRRRRLEMLQLKAIPEAVKKTNQVERMLGNAAADSGASKQLAQEAEMAAIKSSKVANELLREERREKRRAALLGKSTAGTLEEIRRHERVSKVIKKDMKEAEQIKTEVSTVEDTVKKTRVALQKDISLLSRLLKGLEMLQSRAQYEVVLSDVWAQLKEVQLRLSGSGALERKMRVLRDEAEQQRLKIQEYEAEIEGIQTDKANLEDIVHTLPTTCSG
ncbi:laminin subunit gamma-3 [Ambystoma mexicanum]|uniref:laminin subunit gamma-3 n=1 Tax=Ambystoma mexicanum TaxID=8296 RepID=UPI0037E76D27